MSGDLMKGAETIRLSKALLYVNGDIAAVVEGVEAAIVLDQVKQTAAALGAMAELTISMEGEITGTLSPETALELSYIFETRTPRKAKPAKTWEKKRFYG